MSTVLEQLTTPLTVTEVKAAIYDAIEASGARTTSWKPGAVVRTMIAGVAIALASMSQLIALIARSGFLTLSTGSWLTLVARYIYGTERLTGTFATGAVTIDNASGNVYALVPGDIVLLNSTTNKTYRNTAVVNIASLQTGVVVAVQADELGSASSAAAGDIDSFVTPLLGLSVTNAASLVGTDPETDTALRARAMEKVGSLSPNGPRDAYAYFAKSAVRALDGSNVGVTRVKATPDGAGGITVVVASATGAVTGTAGDPSTDLGAVHVAMEENAVPLGITLTTQSATSTTINITFSAWVLESIGLEDAQLTALCNARLVAFFAAMPIGGVVISPADGKVYKQAIEGVLSAAIGAEFLVNLTTSAPAGDTTLTGAQAPALGTLTPTYIRVPEGT